MTVNIDIIEAYNHVTRKALEVIRNNEEFHKAASDSKGLISTELLINTTNSQIG